MVHLKDLVRKTASEILESKILIHDTCLVDASSLLWLRLIYLLLSYCLIDFMCSTANFCVVTTSYLILATPTHAQFFEEFSSSSTDFDWGMFFCHSVTYSANWKISVVGFFSRGVYRKVHPWLTSVLMMSILAFVSGPWLTCCVKNLNCLVDYCSGIKVSYFLLI